MNDQLIEFARQKLKQDLGHCTEAEQMLFKQMYAKGKLNLPIQDVIENMDEDKLDWAMQQVARTLKNNGDEKCTG